jgi:hypothetical protein
MEIEIMIGTFHKIEIMIGTFQKSTPFVLKLMSLGQQIKFKIELKWLS